MKRRIYAVIGWIATHLGLKYLKPCACPRPS